MFNKVAVILYTRPAATYMKKRRRRYSQLAARMITRSKRSILRQTLL